MAVIREQITINNKEFMKNYSDAGFYIERDGVEYEEAIDPIEFAEERIYTETNKPIIDEEIEIEEGE